MTDPAYIPAVADAPVIATGEDAAKFWRARVVTAPEFRPDVEWSVCLLLDADKKLIGHTPPESDGAGAWVAENMRRPFRAALLANAAAIVPLHNHPIGPATASEPDMQHAHAVLKRVPLLGLTLADYVVVNRDATEWFSFREEGLLSIAAEVKASQTRELYADSWSEALQNVEQTDPRLQPLISESAALAGVEPTQWFADFSLLSLQRHFSPAPTEDRRICFAAAVLGRNPAATENIFEAARRAGRGLTEFLWNTGVDRLGSDFNPPAGPASEGSATA